MTDRNFVDLFSGEGPISNCPQYVVISGCSGGGKTTLLEELGRRGFHVVSEPGRRIIAEHQADADVALPWLDLTAFARRAVAVSLVDREKVAQQGGWTFFDRGLIDAAAALEHACGEPAIERYGRVHRYHDHVFLTPPWTEIYRQDADRRHGFDEAMAEYERLLKAYTQLGYNVVILPKVSVVRRADFLLSALRG